MNEFEQLAARKRYTRMWHFFLSRLDTTIPSLHPWKLEF